MGYHNRANYWSCSKVAYWLLDRYCGGRKKSGTAEEWKSWRESAKTQNPFVYWLVETAFNKIQNIFLWPHDKVCDVKIYIQNRFISQTHVLRTGVEPGKWYEFDTRILHGLFNEFVDFIEIEKAHHNFSFCERNKLYDKPWYLKLPYFIRVGQWRCPEAGLDHLDWESKLVYTQDWGISEDDPRFNTPTPQAESAKEQLRLYNWWKHVRPNRPDPYDVAGWTQLYENRDSTDVLSLFIDKDETQRQLRLDASKKVSEIEKQYDDEDTEMMISLIKLRQGLWT